MEIFLLTILHINLARMMIYSYWEYGKSVHGRGGLGRTKIKQNKSVSSIAEIQQIMPTTEKSRSLHSNLLFAEVVVSRQKN